LERELSTSRHITKASPDLSPRRPIASIKVSKRYRHPSHHQGAVAEYAASIAANGLIHPIVISPDGTLIAGNLRLEACKKLGWTTVPVRVLDTDDTERAEVEENTVRMDFLPSEIDSIRRAREAKLKADAKVRMTKGGRGKKGAKISQPFRTTDKIGAIVGVSGRQVEKIAAIMDAVKAEPSKFGHLKEMIDRPHGVTKAHFALLRKRDQERVLNLAPVTGKFKTLVVDPPWPADIDFLGRAMPQYSLMTREAILELPVAVWAEDDCHLYLWVTNSNLPLACECMKIWGFQHKTALTWAKPKFGLGKTFRGQTEHVLFGIRGKLGTRCTNISTLFHAPMGGHSEKPEKFFEIVRATSYPPFGEAFQRKPRPDFVSLYEQRAASEAALDIVAAGDEVTP